MIASGPADRQRRLLAFGALAVPGVLLVAYTVYGILAEPEAAAEVLPGLVLRVVLLSLCVVVVVVEVAIRAPWAFLVVPVGAMLGLVIGIGAWVSSRCWSPAAERPRS